ncbi:50S ribosomal protein L25/general stress protein Ctc [Microbacterium halophytorum]|uniref:50S ribosomal protein L25/general stress protein Ctc n=1 Tax=Microbacterium halophytorum TaxID=2067568 RepID=UPI000CFCCB0E|nr:50S ribosomal protein L25/general stress protein Ctc [Microbacterium halophytorum]
MSDNITLAASVRTEFGKGYARRLRAAGQIPAVIYGHGEEPTHVALPAHETGLIVRHANAVIDLDIEGKSQLVLVKDVQRNPVTWIIEHMDLVIVKRGEKMQVSVPFTIEGESFAGTIHTQSAASITVEADAMSIPEHLTVSIEGLEDGALVHAGDVELPKGVTLVDDADLLVVAISTPRGDVEEETEGEGAEDESAEESAE